MINNIQFILGNGNLGRPQPGFDYVSGYLIYSDTVASGFTHSVAKQIFSVANAESLGIVGNYSDETKAVSTIAVSATGSIGDTCTINITEPAINSTTNLVSIAYTRQASDTTNTLLATSIANTVNASGTGYSATNAGATVSISAKSGMGVSLNTGTPVAVVNSGSASIAVATQFTGGVASIMAPLHYQISEFFRMNLNGILWVAFFPTGTTTFEELNNLQSQANGIIRQVMVENASATSTSTMLGDIDKLQARAVELFTNYTPVSVLYAPNFNSITDLSTLPNLGTKNDYYVSVVIGQDCGNLGANLALTCAKSVSIIGACLGAVSLAKVSEDIAWVQKFNISDGSENETIGFINKTTWNTLYGSSKSLLNQLDNFRYIFGKKINNYSGTFFNESNCAVSITSDYAYIENNRTISKAVRNAYAELTPLVASPIFFNNDGTLSDITISGFEDASKPSLNQMVSDGELSGYKIVVDPTQNVQSTGTIVLTIQLLGVGIARNITVNIGYVLSL